MTTTGERGALLRGHEEEDQRVTFIELFFDLVYVLAVTQLSHLLLSHLTMLGAAQTGLLLLAVWFAWIDTSWVTNWFNPNRPQVRLMLVGAMLVSLIMSAALPEAFGQRGLVFACAFVTLQLGRTGFVVLMLGSQPRLRRNFQRILAWFVVSGVLWLAGGFATETSREYLWLAAVVVDYAGPVAGFFTPGLGRSGPADWNIMGGHLAERCQQFLIIALGESIAVIGATFTTRSWTVSTVSAFVVAFISTVALWWIYFYRSAEGGRMVIAGASDPGRLGRSAYTYFHLPMVAGIIVAAVAYELTIAHPEGHADAITAAVIVGGPVLFVAGHALYKWALSGRVYASRLVAIAALLIIIPTGSVAPLLVLSIAVLLVLVVLASWEVRIVHVTDRGEQKDQSESTASMATSEVAR